MKRLLLLLIVVGGLILGTDMDLKAQSAAKEEMRVAKAPLFRDPIHDGAADPMVIYNEQEKAWYMFYTNRRANVPTQGTNWCYGTRIGVAVMNGISEQRGFSDSHLFRARIQDPMHLHNSSSFRDPC